MKRILLLGCCACVLVALWVPATAGGNDSIDANHVRQRREPAIEIRIETYLIESSDQRSLLSRGQDLKEDANCSTGVADSSMDDFPEDLFTPEQRRHGAVALHALLGFYCFVMTALVCHDYLLPSVDQICVKMNISTDVAGATFLAMASSFPEMFVNVIGTFLTQSDLGTGTVVGSAVFDTFATPACGALIAVHAIPLEWQTLTRDCAMYVISVSTLVIIMWDDVITWYESVILLVLFFLYLILLFCAKRVKLCARRARGRLYDTTSAKMPSVVDSKDSLTLNERYKQRSPIYVIDRGENPEVAGTRPNEHRVPESTGPLSLPENPRKASMSEYLFTWPREKGVLEKSWYLFTWPLKFLLFITIPDARIERFRNWFPLTFVLSVVWIGITSYLLSWMMTVIGDTAGIPDSIMGLTFLAAGGNVPEVASIAILAKKGDGNMAMSNTLGANILDILLCLGLPWTIKCLMTNSDLKIDSGTLSYSVLSIVVCIVVLYAVIWLNGFKLNKKVGVICLLLYTIFVVFASLVEIRVFSPDDGKSCKSL